MAATPSTSPTPSSSSSSNQPLCSVGLKTSCGSSLLHLAARQGHDHVVEWLLTPEANLPLALITSSNDVGLDAFTLAAIKGRIRCVELIADRVGRTNFTLQQVQQAHDMHQLAAERTNQFRNNKLLNYLRQWMQELEVGREGRQTDRIGLSRIELIRDGS